jgi:hypothetical protein
VSFQNIACPAPGQGVADRSAPRGRYNPTRGPGQSAPFAALDHAIAGDPNVSPLGKAVLLALLFWARGKDHCWPSDVSIGARVGRSVGTVQRALRQLESLGLIVREKTTANRTGRLIRLAFLRAGDRPPLSSAREVTTPRARDEGDRIREGEPSKENGAPPPERRRPDEVTWKPVPTPPALAAPEPPRAPSLATPEVETPDHAVADNQMISVPNSSVLDLTSPEQARLTELSEATRARVVELLATGAPILIKEARRLLMPRPAPEPSPETMALDDLLRGLPGRPDRVASAAGRLARELGDHRSYGFYSSVAASVSRRENPAEALVMALAEGMNPMAKRPGAVFAHAWKLESRAV